MVSVALALASLLPATAFARITVPLVVTQDRGGVIRNRVNEIKTLNDNGDAVELRGTCLSSCTLYLGVDHSCVASDAVFGFHGPSRYGAALSDQGFHYWSEVMAAHYREPLKSWFLKTGRYELKNYYKLTGAQLISLGYRACDA